MQVKTLKAQFLEEFGLSIRVYEGRSFADESATLASIRKGDNKGGDFSPKKNTKVGNLEDKFMELFGLKTQITGSDDSYFCDNDFTLAKAKDIDDAKIIRKEKKDAKVKSEDVTTTTNDEIPAGDYEIYLKSEPSGEISMGKLTDEDVSELIALHGTDKYSDSELLTFEYSERNELCNVYGIFGSVSLNGSLADFDVEEEIEEEVCYPSDPDDNNRADGFYIIYTKLSKISDQFSIPLGDALFDPEKLLIKKTDIDLDNHEVARYGEIVFSVINEILYDGEAVEDYFEDFVDGGFTTEIFIFQVKDGEMYDIYHQDEDGDETWGEIKAKAENKCLVHFRAEQCGELGVGELTGNVLEDFRVKFDKKELGNSTFIDSPFDLVSNYETGIFAMDSDLEGWEIPEADLITDEKIGILTDEDDNYKAGIYLIYTVLSDRYSVEFEVSDKNDISLIGPEINLAGLEPDFEAGELDEMILVNRVSFDGEEKHLFDFMTDMDGLRQSVMIVEVDNDGDVNELYSNRAGEESYC